MIVIALNGEKFETETGANVSVLLQDLAINITNVAIELNGEILPKSQYEKTTLNPGDKIEIINFVGGG